MPLVFRLLYLYVPYPFLSTYRNGHEIGNGVMVR